MYRIVSRPDLIIHAFWEQSVVAVDYFDAVQRIYIAFYQRPADPGGMKYWAARIEAADGDVTTVIDAFANSREATSLYGEITKDVIGDVIEKIYLAVFGRAADMAGKVYYEAEFAKGSISAGNIALAILSAARNQDKTAIANKVAVANEFTQKVDGHSFDDSKFGSGLDSQFAYGGETAAAAARAFLAGVTDDLDTVPDSVDVRDILLGNGSGQEAPGGGGGGDTKAPPAPIITAISIDDNGVVTATGTSEANATISFTIDGIALGFTTKASPEGIWVLDEQMPADLLLSGASYDMVAYATDAAGNKSAASVAHTVNYDNVDPEPGEPGTTQPGSPDDGKHALTTGADTILGTEGDDVITATITPDRAVLGSDDIVDGAEGTDTFKITDTATGSDESFRLPAGLVIKNIEKLELTTSGAFGAADAPVDLSTIAALDSVTIAADGSGSMSVKVSDATGLDFKSASLLETVVSGGKNVTLTAPGSINVSGAGLQTVTVKDSKGANIDNTGLLTDDVPSGKGKTLSHVILDAVTGTTTIRGQGVDEVTLKGNSAGWSVVNIVNSPIQHSLTVNLDGTSHTASSGGSVSTVSDVTADIITINAIGAQGALSLGGSTGIDSALTKIVIKGEAALSLMLSGVYPVLGEIDGSAATGALSLSSNSLKVGKVSTGLGNDKLSIQASSESLNIVRSGGGDDSITLSGSFLAGTEVSTGEGNDSVSFEAYTSLVNNSFVDLGVGDDRIFSKETMSPAEAITSGVTIYGGDGMDSLDVALISANNASQFHGFDILSLSSKSSFGSGNPLNVSSLVNSSISALSIDGTAGGSYSGLSTSHGLTVNQGIDVTAGTPFSSLSFSDVAGGFDSYVVTFNAAGSEAQLGKPAVHAGIIGLNGIEAIEVHSGASSGVLENVVTLYAESATSVLLTGDQALDVSFYAGSGNLNGMTTIDGSHASGNLHVDLAGVRVAPTGISVSTGTGDDVIVAQASGTQTFSGGKGKDVFDVSLALGPSSIVTIEDLEKGDIIRLANVSAEGGLGNATDVSAAGAGNLETALGIAADELETGGIAWFYYEGDTYVYTDSEQNTQAGMLDGADNIVRIAGMIDLQDSLYSAAGDLTVGAMPVSF